MDDELREIARLEALGELSAAHARAIALAQAHPHDVRAQVAAAYACDRNDREHDAIRFYDAAWKLGVPLDEQPGFLLGYGSTLRNVGRVDEAISILTDAVRRFPDRAEFSAFLALALHSAGRSTSAVATLLKSALQAARPDGFGPYRRALAEYQQLLADEAAH